MSLRRLTSLVMLFSFIIMSFSGIVLFLVPWGDIADWINWRFLGLNKLQYEKLHVAFMVVFVAFGIIHIYLNWKSILNYLKNKKGKISFKKSELIVSLGIITLFFIGSIYTFQPFKSYFDFEVRIKSIWLKGMESQPPYSHAEESSLKVLCKKTSIDLTKALEALKKEGIRVDSIDESLKEIALHNNTTPAEIHAIIKPFKEGSNKGAKQ
ncbi:DUF4405 domain-containing protein [Hippea alviniae]|uniref:DUF4405 domain-containing protein n=1 Tax=Hippea alviniae TaxID=1279027 RepID=UPI0003B79CFF|nr:DUF4405 domain-containing protein [Hippea alviniae]